jgi:Holliday junction resolvasome RuvABC endonuclease subunit
VSLQTGLFKTEFDKVVMGLDLSLTATGVVTIDKDGMPCDQRVMGYGLKKGSTQKQKIERLIDVPLAISAVVEEMKPDVIAIENFAFGARFGGEFLGELHGVVKTHLYSKFGIVPYVYPPTTVRKSVFGYGGSDKKRIKAIVDKLEEDGVFGVFRFGDHNTRDAWAVAEHARRELSK